MSMVDHSVVSVQVNQYFTHFISTECRRNDNKFKSYEEYLKYSIYTLAEDELGDDDYQAYFFADD